MAAAPPAELKTFQDVLTSLTKFNDAHKGTSGSIKEIANKLPTIVGKLESSKDNLKQMLEKIIALVRQIKPTNVSDTREALSGIQSRLQKVLNELNVMIPSEIAVPPAGPAVPPPQGPQPPAVGGWKYGSKSKSHSKSKQTKTKSKSKSKSGHKTRRRTR